VPSIASANGLNTQVFFDDFNSIATIDINNTGNAGYNWYPNHNAYPSFVNGTCGWYLNGYTPTPASEISVANSVLTLGFENSAWNPLQTINAGVTNGSYVGTDFAGNQSFLLQFRAQFPSAGIGGGDASAFWLYSRELYIGTANKWQEIDIAEPTVDRYDAFIFHDWSNPPSSCTESNPSDYVLQSAPSWSDGDWHTYDILYTCNSSTSWTVTRFRWHSVQYLHMLRNQLSELCTFYPTALVLRHVGGFWQGQLSAQR
jgi:hypothetical protein